jgi:hypothetical protein
MIKIDKSVIIKYSKAGINQYATVNLDKDKITSTQFTPFWVNSIEVPSLESCKTLEEILNIIAEFSFNTATIHLINGQLPAYYYNKDLSKGVDIYKEEFYSKKSKMITDFFKKYLAPIMDRNKWKFSSSHIGRPILIYKNEEGEWDNILEDEDSQLLSYVIQEIIDTKIKTDDTPESTDIRFGGDIYMITNYLDKETLDKYWII